MSMLYVLVPAVGGGVEDVCASASLSIVWKNFTMVRLLLGLSTWMCACLNNVFFGIMEKCAFRSMREDVKLMLGKDIESMVAQILPGVVVIRTAKLR